MSLKLQKQSALKFAGRIIPRSGGYNTPQRAREMFLKLAFGFHTRDFAVKGTTKFVNTTIYRR